MRSVLATIFGLPAEEVADFLVVVKVSCRRCGQPYCEDGPLATASGRQGIEADGTTHSDLPFDLHLTAMLIEVLARQWGEESHERLEG